jgi:Tfp pilus assembly protein PilE
MKLNFWQILGVLLLLAYVAYQIYIRVSASSSASAGA